LSIQGEFALQISAAVALQYLLPKRLLTLLAGKVANCRGGAVTHALIRRFVRHYEVDMSEAAAPSIESYATFNDFFTRGLREGTRPVEAATFVSPVDGCISEVGAIEQYRIVQAKGHSYTVHALLAGDDRLSQHFHQGQFATIYLAPKDYHRVHMPCDGRLVRMIYVPGDLFSVNPETARHVPGLFARNERVICVFEAVHGTLAVVLVGATIVGSISMVWHGVVCPPRARSVREWHYRNESVVLRKGQEMGRFLLGSTVILLFPEKTLDILAHWGPEKPVRMGEAMSR
jgi:phosphatidylserine decarboxylase